MQTKFRHIVTPRHFCLAWRPLVIASDENDGAFVVDDDGGGGGNNDGDGIAFLMTKCDLSDSFWVRVFFRIHFREPP